MDMREDMVEKVAHKLSGRVGPSGTDSESLQGWQIKFRDHRKKTPV